MRHVLFLVLFAALSLDFSVADTVLLPQGARAVQWDDEEESVPTRRQRVDGEDRRVDVLPAAPRSLEQPPTPRWTTRGTRADRSHPPTAWLVPIRRSLVPSLGSASPAEDH